jgi:hypothetical protein
MMPSEMITESATAESSRSTLKASAKSAVWQQVFKWTVYSLLTLNFALYFYDDWVRAAHTISETSNFESVLSAFATSLAVLAWIVLLLMLELETYLLEDEQFSPRVEKTLHSVRAVCVIAIGYTIFAFGEYVVNITPTKPVAEETPTLCALAGRELSFTSNLAYIEITAETCQALSADERFYWVDGTEVVTDASGLVLERWLAWGDLIEIATWIIILVSIEVVVRMQDRGITHGFWMVSLNRAKTSGYLILTSLGLWWGYLGHWLYLWDTVLWIGGFIAIEGNLRDWRNAIKEKQGANGSV